MNLLIVDDEPAAIKAILTCVDWSIVKFDELLTANSFSQAVNVFRNSEIDVLLCDVEMPLGNGLELVSWVNQNYPAAVCIMLTCHDEFDSVKQAVQLNCSDYILKPANPITLQNALLKAQKQSLIEKKKSLYQHYGKALIEEEEGSDSDEEKDIVDDTIRYILQNIGEKISVEMLASRVYVSPNHLTRLFKKKCNTTVIDYITDKRMELAGEMMKNPKVSVSKVSAKVGYTNFSYFTKQFKKTYGVTPSEYISRNMIRE